MKRPAIRSVAMFLGATIGFAAAARAQCPPRWSDRFGGSGLNDYVSCLTVFDDDGAGPNPPALYAGGQFLGGTTTQMRRVARWNGRSWSKLGSGMNNPVTALASFDDDGPGPHPAALYAGGAFTTAGGVAASHVARWNGTAWSPLGSGTDLTVYAMAVYDDDGAGPHLPALIVAGSFTTAGGVVANRIAKWDGSSWSPLGNGIGDVVEALAVFDEDGDGPGLPALFAGGSFTTAGGGVASHVARWDGSAWSPVGGGMDGNVWALTVFDGDGDGPNPPALYAGGEFAHAGGGAAEQVAKWDGVAWSPLGAGMQFDGSDTVFSLAAFDDDGAGPHPPGLYAGGHLDAPSSNGPYITKWNGSSWSVPQSGVDNSVFAMTSFDDDGAGPDPAKLYVGGTFLHAVAGGADDLNRIGTWDGQVWATLQHGLDGTAMALCPFDGDGSGPAAPVLAVGGSFVHAGTMAVHGVAGWNGASFAPFGEGPGLNVASLCPHDADGSGPGTAALYAGTQGGDFDLGGIFSFDGIQWSPVGPTEFNGDVLALVSFGPGGMDPPLLYAGGRFTFATSQSVSFVGQWDGASWTNLGTGVNDAVDALAVYDGSLVAGGKFTTAGGVAANRIARWDGSSWSPLGTGLNGEVHSLFVFDDDGGGPNPPALYAGGDFTAAGGVGANRIAKWDGASWSALGSGMNGRVCAITAFDEDAGGPIPSALYAGGGFTTAGGSAVGALARWSGTSWSRVGGGITESAAVVLALSVFDDDGPEPPALYATGGFTLVDGNVSMGIARWSACEGSVATFCPGDGTGAACPCANSGASGHGCDNSSATGGAVLAFTGEPSLSGPTLVLTSSGEKPTALSTFWQGTVSANSLHYGDGLRCFGGAMKRLYSVNAIGGVVTAPSGGQPSIPVRSAALGNTITPGSTRYYQTSYRDPDPAFCPQPAGSTFNVSSGLVVLWGP